MNVVAHFEKVSYEEFEKSWAEVLNIDLIDNTWMKDRIHYIYDSLQLPKRSTSGSAGYDFFAPNNISIRPLEATKIPTGIRCRIENGWVLAAFPRSGLGFKYGVRLANTVGIIDSDYYFADNEGHIFIKLVNDSSIGKTIEIERGKAFAQGIFLPFGITDDDATDGVRTGGFGSTDK